MAKITRYVFRPLIVVIFLIGLVFTTLTGFDAFVGDGNIPEFEPASIQIKAIAEKSLTVKLWGPGNRPHQEYWEGLRGSLTILDEINPAVAGWIRNKERSGKLRFIEHEAEMAKFDYYNGMLSISHFFFSETEKKKVAWLCHEYRHSRQNFGKVGRYILSWAYGSKGKPEIVENDAYLYEREAEAAMSPAP